MNVQFQKISIPTLRRVIRNSKGEGVQKPKLLNESIIETKLEFPEGWGIETKNPFVGGVWIFSGITQLNKDVRCELVLCF